MVCRSEIPIPEDTKNKIALFCNVRPENVVPNLTASNLYEVPLMLEEQGLAVAACKHLQLDNIEPNNEAWKEMITNIKGISGKDRLPFRAGRAFAAGADTQLLRE